MLEINGLQKKFRKKVILDNIDLSIEKGVYALLGPNGAGKTTLLRCIAGLYDYRGTILLDGNKITDSINIGYLPQCFSTFPEMTIYEVLKYFCVLKKIKKEETDNEIKKCLQLVHLSDKVNEKISRLSGGMLRRTGIAQALIGKPQLLLLDEPTSELDIEERMNFKKIINAVKGDCTIIISTHLVEDVESICDKFIVLKDGTIIETLPPLELAMIAQDKLFEIKSDLLPAGDLDYWVEREYYKDGVSYSRVLAKSMKFGNKIDDICIEDGYMALIKNI
ncbi:MAG: ATP-binding cassette domain-containing protein [Thermoflexaceae bacterium]|nr:ATP-binding cassette domain-containing protein [Thermoflexaceae bacterium]